MKKSGKSSPFVRVIKSLLLFGAVCFILMGGLVVYFQLTSSLDSPEVDPALLYSEQTNATVPATAETPAPSGQDAETGDAAAQTGDECEVVVTKGTVARGATAGVMLQEWMPASDVNSFLAASEKVFSLRNIREGQPFTVVHNSTGFDRFEYEIDNDRKLVVQRSDESFSAAVEKIEYDVLLDKVEGTISSSLFDTMAKLGESPALAVNLADIFAWEINFIRDIQEGDSFRLLVEKRFRDGDFKGYGPILIAEFVNQGKSYEGLSYRDSSGRLNYYNTKGESVKRAFLKAPLSFTRISSRFTNRRFHPVLQTWKSHPAIDYAAPTGTPVKAIGDGSVIFKGWGQGAGNYITLKHHGGYESMYLHLSGFAKTLQKGKSVRQGDVIGFVGSTGYSTGPHLDFRMKKNGQFINPEKSLSPRAEPLGGKELGRFKARVAYVRQYLDGTKSLTDYALEKDRL